MDTIISQNLSIYFGGSHVRNCCYILFCKKIGEIVESKGYRSFWYKLMTVGFWIGGEVVGAIFGAILLGASAGECAVYLFALAGAVGGASVAFLIATNLPPGTKDPNFDNLNL